MRKIILVISALFILSSCASIPVNRVQYKRYHGAIDYSVYTARGFFITESNSVSFGYEPIGSVYAVVKSGWEVLNRTTKRNTSDDEVYGTSTKVKINYGEYINADLNDAIEELYLGCIELEADGVINFSFSEWDGEYVVSGMAIKRK
jgi:hypothetical protein